MTRVPPTGWYVEIDDPQTGNTWRPSVVGDPEVIPGVTDYPRIRIPVRKRDRWFDPRFEGATMRVWKDGRRQPIEQLEDVNKSERGVELRGRGAVELEQPVTLEVDNREAHRVVEDLITNRTSYQANVDTPAAATRLNETVQSANSLAELEALLQPVLSTQPLELSNGTLKLLQAAFHVEGEQLSLGGTQSDGAASEGQYERLDGNYQADGVTRTVPYTIPGEHVGVAIRYRNPNDTDGDGNGEGMGFAIEVDGERVQSFAADFNAPQSFQWSQYTSGLSSGVSGSTTIRVDDNGGTSGELTEIDLLVLYDTRFSWTFDNTTDSDNLLSGPELFPYRAGIDTVDVLTAFQFTGGRLEADFDDTSNGQRVGVSNDRGQSYVYADNSQSVEADFSEGRPRLRGRLELSRYGTGNNETPTTGYKGQTVDLYDLKGDIDETPLLVDRDYDEQSLIDVIRDIANYGDFVGEFRLTGGVPSFEFTRVGQRVAGDASTPASYDFTKRTEPQVDTVTIKSGRQQVREETITASHGTAVDLANGLIDRGTESVYDPQSGTEYDAGEDYELSPGVETDVGAITALASGDIADGQTIAVDYAYHFKGTSAVPNPPANPTPLTRTFPELTSQRAVDQAAALLRRQLDEPFNEVTVTLPTSEVGFNVVEAQQFGALPTDTKLEILEITTSVAQTEFRLGDRESIGDAVQQIRDRLSAAASRA